MKNDKNSKDSSDKLMTNVYLPNMKSKLKFILVAENALVDQSTGKMSVIGLFSDINIPKESKSVALNFVVAGQLFAEEAENAKEGQLGTLTINIKNPDGSVLRSATVSGPFETGGRVQFTLYFQLVEFTQIGEYGIEAILDGDPCVKDDRLCYFNVNKNG